MKIRALGTGHFNCKHPLFPACFLVYTNGKVILIGCPPGILQKLSSVDCSIDAISLIIPLNETMSQWGGLLEIADHSSQLKDLPFISTRHQLSRIISDKFKKETGTDIDKKFKVREIVTVTVKEEYYSETISLVQNYNREGSPSYGVKFEDAKIFISGDTTLNEEWLFKQMDCDLIAHACKEREDSISINPHVDEINMELPVYLQNKMWLYGYESDSKTIGMPYPMMYLPPLVWIYDSERKGRVLSKERYLKESAKKQIG